MRCSLKWIERVIWCKEIEKVEGQAGMQAHRQKGWFGGLVRYIHNR